MIKNSTNNTGTIPNRTRGLQLLMILSLLMIGTLSKAQIIYNESFDVPGIPVFPVSSLPFGWSQGKFGGGVDPDNYWDRMGVGATLPNCNPRTGNAMMRYRSWLITAGEASFLASKRFDMRNIPLVGAPVSFWMYRDEGLNTTLDNIRVYVNTTPDMLGTPLQLTAAQINRPCNQTPIVACPVSYNVSGWNNYAFTIPNSYNGASVYVIILGNSADGNHMFIDDFSITSYPNLEQAYVSSAVVLQNSATTAKGKTRQEIIGCRITMDGAVSAANRAITGMLFNTIGSSNPVTDIVNARLWYTGGSSSFDTLTATQIGVYTPPHVTNFNCVAASAFWVGSAAWANLEHGDNYFWVTYDINATAVSGNCVDAEWVSLNYRVTKTGVTGASGSPDIVVSNNTGLVVGMVAAGAGVSPGTLIASIAGTTITLANNNTAAVAGTVNFTLTANPTPQTLAGCREIDVIYCIPTYFVGTSWLNYNTNDYIANVTLVGNATAPPGINNSLNSVGPNAGGCAGGPCPFSTHPPDYELFPAVPGRTAALTADGTTNYPISLKVGTYCCSNYIAAWIDLNKDGDFNDAGEKIAQSGSLSNGQVYNTTFQVPVTATTGTTRLRVREVWIQPNIDPCASYTYGETEDYVVTLLPTCGVPGWKTWLGFTDDWDNPSNWCGGVPTIADNARLPGTGGVGYYRPVIKPGVFATTRKLRIEPNDTLYIKAWNNSTLTVADSMYMMPAAGPLPNGVVNVISALVDTAQVYNGQLSPSPSLTPLKNALKARSFWMFTQAELIARGLVANDLVTEIKLHLQRYSNANPYTNLEIKYYYTNAAFVFVPGVNATIPPVALAGAPIYGPLNTATATFIPIVLSSGTITFPVNFTWNGNPAYKLVIEMCYQNVSSTGTSDQPRYTQTLGFRNYGTMLPAATISPNACDMIPSTTQTSSTTAGSNTINVTNGAILMVNQLVALAGTIPSNTYITSIVGNIVTMSNNALVTSGASTLTFGANVFWTASDFRPNLTFKYDRPFNRYEIEVRGAWGNNGVFTPGKSRVTMGNAALAGVNPVQNLAGSSITTFADLRIFNNNHVYAQNDFIVQDTLQLTSGRLKLNNRLVTLNNPTPAAITRINGFLQSDQDVIANNVGPYGRLKWNIGSTVGTYILPFVNSAGISVFMDYITTAGTHNPIFATHGTAPSNLSTPVPITNINGYFTGTNNSSNMVDRYFMIDNTAGSGGPTANINLRYANSERAAGGNVTMTAQRWLAPSAGWEFPFITGQTHTVGSPDLVAITGFNLFSTNVWWTITQNANPLPVSMLDFAGKPYQDKVKLTWETASEINNSHFIIERTTDQLNFDYIGRVESQGSSSSIAKYSIWDEQPLQGIQYYYLRQYDIDGTMKSFGPVSATFSRDLFDIVTATAVNAELGLIVEFDYNSEETYKYSVVDMLGKVLATQDKNVAQPGRNKIEIDVKLSQGVYQIILQNSEKVVSKKFYYDKL